jgi:hypothetical protein
MACEINPAELVRRVAYTRDGVPRIVFEARNGIRMCTCTRCKSWFPESKTRAHDGKPYCSSCWPKYQRHPRAASKPIEF